jgi:nucleotide-binding universal stress UspA family protein
MSLKDILVIIDEDAGRDVAGPYAASLASALGAHVTATSIPVDPLRGPYAAGIPEAYLAEFRARSQESTAAAATRFMDLTRTRGVSAEIVRFDDLPGRVGAALGELGRHFDVTILAQPEHAMDGREAVADAILFESGRPMIMVPYIRKEPAAFDRVMVAWDGSDVAARAIGGAMTLLEKAARVEVVTVARDRNKGVDFPGFNIARHLARHGIKAELQTIPGDLNPADALLSHAADASADLLVMGGYGNMRLRDLIFGGTTKGILETMTLPVFMAH